MSRLFAFGCSITYGEGLPDCWDGVEAGPKPSKFAWPQLSANELNLECINLGVPGVSNKQICNDILNTNFLQTDIVVIMWTFFNRTCFFQDNEESSFGGSSKSRRLIIQDVDNTKLDRTRRKYVNTFYKTFYTNTNANIENYMYINFVRAMLDEKKIKNYHISCNKNATHWSHPKWNSVNLHNISNRIFDKAQDNKHPGMLSHKSISYEVTKKIISDI